MSEAKPVKQVRKSNQPAKPQSGAEPLKALKEAVLRVDAGGATFEFECAVLEGEIRVISERAFSRAIGAKRGGSHWQRAKKGADSNGAKLPVFLSAYNLNSFIDKDLAEALSSPIVYKSGNGTPAHGIRAELIPRILDVWLKARDKGALSKKQEHFAVIAEVIMRGLATTGIVALIDEATGHQYDRDRDALAKVLEAFVDKALKKWVRRFPSTWFIEICRLRTVPFRADMKLPQYFGGIVNDLVYDRLAPGVRAKLQEKNPSDATGKRKSKHHQWLTQDIGIPELIHLLGIQEGLAKAFDDGDWDGFYARVEKVIPKHPSMPLFEIPRDDPNDIVKVNS